MRKQKVWNRRSRTIALMALICVACFAVEYPISRLSADDVSDGRRALEKSSDFPWYDSTTDSLKKVPLQQSAAPASQQRNSSYKANPKKGNTTPRNPGRTGPPTGGNVNFSFVSLILWVFVGLFLIMILAFLLWAFLRREKDDESELKEMLGAKRLQTDVERIENLPFDVRAGTGTLFDQARAAYEAGKYREAMIYLYSHMLVQMDRQHWIRLSKSKTNRQYLHEVRGNRPLRKIFRKAMLNFEATFFGFHDLNRSSFEDCWNAMKEFDAAVSQSSGS